MANPKMNKLLSKIDLAILANGGENWRVDWCRCDPDVGFSPCEYCAVYTALKETKEFISNIGTSFADLAPHLI